MRTPKRKTCAKWDHINYQFCRSNMVKWQPFLVSNKCFKNSRKSGVNRVRRGGCGTITAEWVSWKAAQVRERRLDFISRALGEPLKTL